MKTFCVMTLIHIGIMHFLKIKIKDILGYTSRILVSADDFRNERHSKEI